jgi:macrolide transport system ATP-binding/permease protein
MLLTVSGIARTFGPSEILRDITFVLNPAERVGLVGANGAGKSTLLRILAGELDADAGSVSVASGVAIGYLPQQPPEPAGKTIADLLLDSVGDLRRLEARLRELEAAMADPALASEALEATMLEYGECAERFERRGGYEIDYRADIVFAGLRIDHIPRERRFATLSGGEKSRVLLAALLLGAPDLLLLDEPTNHLDFATISWLEAYLASYRGAFLVISHDRHFLNNAVTRILEIDEHSRTLKDYPGAYDAYLTVRERERDRWELEHAEQQEEIRELKRAIRLTARQVAHNRPPRDGDKMAYAFFGGRVQNTISRNVRNAEERLRRIEADPVPRPPDLLRINPEFDIDALRGDNLLSFERVSLAFGEQPVLSDISATIGPRERIVLVGPNGAGKSTLLNLAAGLLAPDSGAVRVAPGVRLGYLDQAADFPDPASVPLRPLHPG